MKFYQFALAGLGGAFVLVVLIYLVAYDKAARIDGAITEVRTLAVEQNASVAIVDFEAANHSDILFVVGERKLAVVDEDGFRHQGVITGAFDIEQLFKYFPALGEMQHKPLIKGIKVAPGEALQGVVAARLEISKEQLDARQQIILRVADVDGGVSELSLETEPE